MINISFECENSNQASVMLACWDIVNEVEAEDSFVIGDHIGYLLDFVFEALDDAEAFDPAIELAEYQKTFLKLYRDDRGEFLRNLDGKT